MTPHRHPAPQRSAARRRLRGTTLLEALVAFLVLSLGMLSVARLQTQLRLNSDVARQRSEAVRIAQQEIENLRSFSVMTASGSAGTRAFSDIVSGAATLDATAAQPGSNTRYTVTRSVADDRLANAKSTTVNVAWDDRSGAAQQVVLDTVIAAIDPAYSGALGVAPNNAPFKGALARAAGIPVLAKDLGDGRSVFKPVAAGSVVLVFNNRSGALTSRCTGAAPSSSTATLTAADLLACDATTGLLLSGRIRFSAASPPDALNANDTPQGLAVALATSGGSYATAPQCTSEALKTVVVDSGGRSQTKSVAIDATPASLGLATWQETGTRYVAYHCVVVPLANGQWSGRTTLAPGAGWSIGNAATDWRVCRYSADQDGSGAVDANVEHPDAYTGVDAALANQNFLVVKGSETCPPGAALKLEGGAGDVFVNLATVQHQP